LIGAGLRRKSLGERPPCATRWHRGKTESYALVDCPQGQAFMPFGRVYPSASREPREGTFLTTTGRRVYVEPDVRHLVASEEPNLLAVRVGNSLQLEAIREIRAGDPLTIDPHRPIELATAVRRPRACGRPLHAQPRGASALVRDADARLARR